MNSTLLSFFAKKTKLLVLAVTCMLWASTANAQLTASVSNYISDYYVNINWDFTTSFVETSGFYDCGIDYRYTRCGTTQCGTQYFESGNNWGWGNFTQAWNIGPDQYINAWLSVRYNGDDYIALGPACGSNFDEVRCFSGTSAFATDHIYAPTNVNGSIVSNAPFQFGRINWSKGSDIPDANLQYRIYRNGNLIATLAGNVYTFTDPEILQTGTYTYRVATYTPDWGTQESYSFAANTSVTHNINNDILQATDGTHYNYTRLTWPNLANFASNDIEVKRDGQQIAVVNKNSTVYNDYDGVPGRKYKYTVAPIGSNGALLAVPDSGFARPDGIIRGNVKTVLNAGVSGVQVKATATVAGSLRTYIDTTDASGFYEMADVYYDTAAIFTIVPSKGDHRFDPDTLKRTLSMNNNLSSQVDFRDTTVFTVTGRVAFAPSAYSNNGCGLQSAKIYVNGQYSGINTNANGQYALAIQEEGNYTIAPVYEDHTFNVPSQTLNVVDDVLNVNFTDTKFDTLFMAVRGGCNNEVADYAIVNIASGNCWARTDTIDGQTPYEYIVVPALEYTVSFQQAYSQPAVPDPTIGFNPITVDLRTRDTLEETILDTTITFYPADTLFVANGSLIITPAYSDTLIDSVHVITPVKGKAFFLHRGTLEVQVLDVDSSGCANYPIVMQQDDVNRMRIEVNERYDYGGVIIRCPVDSGTLIIYDDVSDAGVQTLQFENGAAYYDVHVGKPNIASPYKKLLQFFVNVGNSSDDIAMDILVTGHRPRTQTFVTRTPELPFFVVHDPPGDASYSFLAKDSSVSYSYSNSYQVGGAAGAFLNLKIGAGIPIPFTGIVIGASTNIDFDITSGRDNVNTDAVASTFTASQQFSTSGSGDYVGGAGDVFVGGSFNMIYALTDIIDFDGCTVVPDTGLAWGANDLATTYIYTEDHIENTLLPQLQLLQSLSNGDTAQLIGTYIAVWEQVLAKNRRNRDTVATFVENFSFSAGAPYDNTTTLQNDTTTSYEYSVFIDINTAIGAEIGDGGDFNETAFGVQANFNWNTTKNTESTSSQTQTFGYHLEDSNPGDFFSVDVLKDKTYGTPSFRVVAGTSSCPHEEGTQARDMPEITLDNYVTYNVPINQPANYVAHLYNLSESGEARTYNVQVVPESNLDGALVTIAGQQINNLPASFTIPANQQIPAILSVTAGPLASDYNDLQVQIYSDCDPDQSDVVTFSAHFQSTCSPIGIYTPSDNWLVNQANNDTLVVIFSGYNASNPELMDIGLEYRHPGGAWILATNPPVPVVDLTAPYRVFFFDVSNMPDGDYEIRAFANCGAQPGGKTYSQVLSGKIDRNSLVLFGTPSPSDGTLNINEDISVTFNEPLDCNQQYNAISTTLINASTGAAIPHTFVCSGSSILIQTTPPSLIDSLQNVQLIASVANVRDVNGNELQQPVVWSFVVNRSQIFWNPSNMNGSAVVGVPQTLTATMANVASLADTFVIMSTPSWLSTPTTLGIVNGNGTFNVNFTLQNGLNPGHYTDTVIAVANGTEQFLFVNLDVVKPSPNWTVNPADFQYSMNITTNFTITSADSPLSTDMRDKVAVFVGDQCRGVADINYVPAFNKYVAFITAYSNSAIGDTFEFRMWDAQPGTEYQAVERLNFVTDGSIGQPMAPYILHPAGIFQTIPMQAGWNWFSLNVTTPDMTPDKVLSAINPASGDVVKTQNTYAQYTGSSNRWIGDLTQFDRNSSYMMYLSQPDTLRFLGNAVTDTSIVTLAAGWNWVGFPRQDITDVSSYLQSVPATNNDIFKSQDQFANFNGGNWTGSLVYLYPGEGYKMKTANPVNFIIAPDRSVPNWNVNVNQYEYNMATTAKLQFNGFDAMESHYLVGAFANGTCVGIAQPEYIAAENIYRIFLTIHGDQSILNAPLEFKVWDMDNDVEYLPTYDASNFVLDTTVGKVEAPYILNVFTGTGINSVNYTEGYSLLQNVPNPFSSTTSFIFTLPKEDNVSIDLMDQTGRLITNIASGHFAAGDHKLDKDLSGLAAGVYLYRMQSGKFVKTRRLIIQ
jgi:hypothetical protein